MSARKAVKKAGRKAGKKVGVVVAQKHGGAIWQGAPANPVAGTGRPPDAIRAKMRELGADKGIPFLSNLLDGKIEVSLLGKCDACGEHQQFSQEWVEMVMDRLKASVDQRLKATEQTMKYGLAAKELVITSDNAAGFFDCIHAASVELFGAAGADALKVRSLALMEQRA